MKCASTKQQPYDRKRDAQFDVTFPVGGVFMAVIKNNIYVRYQSNQLELFVVENCRVSDIITINLFRVYFK